MLNTIQGIPKDSERHEYVHILGEIKLENIHDTTRQIFGIDQLYYVLDAHLLAPLTFSIFLIDVY